MKKKTNFWQPAICVVCMIIALFCVGLMWYWNNKGGGVVTVDAFIGVAAAFIGVCATVMVGLQIWNHIEFNKVRDRIKNLDEIEKAINDDKKNIVEMRREISIQIGNTYAMLSNQASNIDHRLMNTTNAITCTIWHDNKTYPQMSEVLLGRYNHLCENFDYSKDYEVDINTIKACYSDLNKFTVPQEFKDYTEISKLHFDILSRMKAIIDKTKDNE